MALCRIQQEVIIEEMSNNEMDASPHDSVLNPGSALVNDLDEIEEEEKKGQDEADFAQIVEQQERES